MSGVGILGIGTYLPPEVRHSDWWPAEVVQGWASSPRAGRGTPPIPTTPAMASVIAAMKEQTASPFGGVIERHVMPSGMVATDMELAAAEVALARAGVTRETIDILLVHTAVPEYQLANTACVLHHRLHLPAACLSMEAQASAYSFLAQLALVEPMISAGRVRNALLVQSSAASRLLDPSNPVSAVLGDAATAAVVGSVPGDRGILASVHRTDGRRPYSLVAGASTGRWYDGCSVLHIADIDGERQLFLESVDRGIEVVDAVLAAGGRRADEIDFFAVHQGTPWLRRLTQEHAGLSRARTVDLFARTGYIFGASLPLVLEAGESEGLLAAGDLLVLFGGGTGITFGATLVRWGK